MDFEITHIQLFDYKEHYQTSEYGDYEVEYTYSVNVAINDKFVVQCSSDGSVDIPSAVECHWGDEKAQDWAAENIDVNDIIEQTGLKCDRSWSVDHGAEIMNPENSPSE